MRRLAILVVLLPAAAATADTGISIEETVSGVGYGGDLASYGDSSTRFTFGVVLRQDERALNIVGGCLVDEVSVTWGEGAYCFGGFDLRRTWQLNRLNPHKPRRAGFRLSVEAGPRYFAGNTAMEGYRGPGANADVKLEGDAWLIGYFLVAGVDVMAMRIPVDTLVGVAPYIGIGARVGWL